MPDVPPPDPPSPEITTADLKQRLDETLERLARFERDMPRVVARIAAGLTDGKPTNKPDDRIAALERMLQEEQQRRIRTERENAVRAAVAGVPWVDPEDAVRDLLAKVEERDGRLVVMTSKKYAENGEAFPEALPLDDAVRQLARTKSHWIKADVKGGSGASGSTGIGGGSSTPSAIAWSEIKYRDLKANPVLMQRAITEKGQSWVATLHDKWRQKQAKGTHFQM